MLMAVTARRRLGLSMASRAGPVSRNTDGPSTKLPQWVKLIRAGDTFTGYISADGQNWQRIGQRDNSDGEKNLRRPCPQRA